MWGQKWSWVTEKCDIFITCQRRQNWHHAHQRWSSFFTSYIYEKLVELKLLVTRKDQQTLEYHRVEVWMCCIAQPKKSYPEPSPEVRVDQLSPPSFRNFQGAWQCENIVRGFHKYRERNPKDFQDSQGFTEESIGLLGILGDSWGFLGIPGDYWGFDGENSRILGVSA